MKTYSQDLPAMYGDHHVTEVRRLLFALPGVTDVYASSGFQYVEVQYDEAKLDVAEIETTLESAGYLGELALPVERGAIGERENGDKPYFRHTAASEQTGQTVGFAQHVSYAGRPLWPCPGMGPLAKSLDQTEEELSHG